MDKTAELPWWTIQPRSVHKVTGEAPRLYENATLQKLYATIGFHRPLWFALGLPILLVWLTWLILTITFDLWDLLSEGWIMSLTMVFGALVAGSTPLGGGAVAFPVIAVVLEKSPSVGRDFSLIIQSCGMTAAMWKIFYTRVIIDIDAFIYCSLGGLFGLFFGFEFVVSNVDGPMVKMFFVSFWLSFSVALGLTNSRANRKVFQNIQNVKWSTQLTLVFFGFLGGISTSMTGSGVDICCFAMLTTMYQLNEVVATPTSVALMAVNAIFATILRAGEFAALGPLELEARELVWFCFPIVVIFAPLGAFIASFLHRKMTSLLVYLLTVVQVIAAYAIIPLTTELVVFSVSTLFIGSMLWLFSAHLGSKGNSQINAASQTEDEIPMKENNGYVIAQQEESNSKEEEKNTIPGQVSSVA